MRARPFRMKPGMMVCSGRLPGASSFGWPGSSVKQRAAILQGKAGARRHQPATEAVEDALDERDDVAVAIDGGVRHTVSPPGPVVNPSSRSGSTCAAAWLQVDAPRARRALFREQRGYRRRREAGIADPPQHVGIGELLGSIMVCRASTLWSP